jgi:hypothetical protein
LPIFSRLTSEDTPSTYASHVIRTAGMTHHQWVVHWDRVSITFFVIETITDWLCDPPISTSQWPGCYVAFSHTLGVIM